MRHLKQRPPVTIFQIDWVAEPKTWVVPSWHELYRISRRCRQKSGILWYTLWELCKFCNLTRIVREPPFPLFIEGNAKRWLDAIMISSLFRRAYYSIIPRLNTRISFRASFDIVNRKRSEQHLETCRETDTSTTKNSGRTAFTYTVIGDKPESPVSPKHQWVWETVI